MNGMSRRKQAKPQFVHMDPSVHLDFHTNTSFYQACVHVCENCCAEFVNISELYEHQTGCFKNPLVLIVSENSSSTSLSLTTDSCTHSLEDQTDNSSSTEDPKEFYDKILKENRKWSPVSNNNNENASHFHLDKEINIDSTLIPDHSTVLPQPDFSPEFSFTSSNVVIENLESTNVAVAQFSQDICLNAVINSKTLTNCNMTIMSLIEQLVAVQQQQVQQLKLIEQIRQRILLLSTYNTDKSAPSNSCEGTAEVFQTGLLIRHSSHLSQQLVEAAGLAQSLVSQSTGVNKVRHAVFSSKPDSTVTDTDRSKLGMYLSKKQSDDDITFSTQQSGTSHSSSPEAASSTPNLTNNHSLPHSPTGNEIFEHSLSSIGAIVEDLNALTALAQQKKGKLPNVTLPGYTRASDEGLFKHKCRFCAKVFGSDSALQIHLRSHTGERPYKCNICGNRFSTRGNLKVHFQRHKEKYPNVQMNPYPVPENLDNVPTSTGIPYGMSRLPDKPTSKWLDSRPSVSSLPGFLLTSSLPGLPSIIKREVVSVGRPSSPSISGLNVLEYENNIKDECNSDPTLNGNFKATKYRHTHTNLISTKNSENALPNNDNAYSYQKLSTPFLHEEIKFGSIPDYMDDSETLKLQRLVENIDKKSTDSNECMICHRVLSCQSALKLHYRTHTGEKPYKCKICGRAFTTKGNLKTHHSIHCDMPPLKVQHSCPICQEQYTNAMVLQQHICMHMDRQITREVSEQPNTCSVQEKNLDEDLLNENMVITDGFSDPKNAAFSQDTCTFPTSSHAKAKDKIQEKGSLNDQLDSATIEDEYSSLKLCISNEHSSQKSKSPVCPENFWAPLPGKNILDNNRSLTSETHQEPSVAELTIRGVVQPNLKIDKSDEVFEGGMTMIITTGEQESSKNNVCVVCNKTFACQSALDIHYRSHAKEPPGFSTEGNLKQHVTTHQPQELPVQKSEEANRNLISLPFFFGSHLVSSKIKMEVSSDLNKDGKDAGLNVLNPSGPSLSLLSASQAPSRKIFRQHFCHTCGKTFSSSSALQIHERTHTGEKPFACTVCGRAFTTKGNLKVHLGTHLWNGSPARRGRRLSVEGPYTVLKTNPIKIMDTTPKKHVSESVVFWNQYETPPLSTALALKTNEISVIQNGSIPQVSFTYGREGSSPIGGLTASLDKTNNIEIKKDLAWIERLNENGTCFYVTPFIEESKTD